ncbi:hypothetical protein [Phnomibacter ginsenosidimutans]|uniref:Uncharacterized protein n=1 Tax=Phnomibacter ginsenosidimutans TaxID=2676868 RepID=A0A6I6GIK0_9BACT|nr:hypothetical protein [Phnomibacter ginsenosidimutans]QGW27508.1 hypothetical protein GLV81_04815 [Phnomibacter ginsenosidimutans]
MKNCESVNGRKLSPIYELAVMLRQTIYILTILFLMSCNDSERRHTQAFVVYESDTRDKDIGFKPTTTQIDDAEKKLLDYLETKTKTNQTIFVNSLDGKVPLQDQLKYYKRRYFGRTSIEGEKIIKIEFVFVRCGGQDEWKKVDYTNDNTKDCWWSVQYSVDHDQIYDLKL